MRELDEMISRLRNRGIKVEKVKYPKQTLSEKKMGSSMQTAAQNKLQRF